MRRLTLLASSLLFAAGYGVPVATAHDDDPKILDRMPRYEGPGYRRGGDPSQREAFSSNGLTLMSWMPLGDFGSPANGNDCWGYVSGSGREYALMGLSNGTAFVEVTDPGNPVIVTQISGPQSLWRDIKVYGDYAYAVSEGGSGIQVFNLSQIDNGTVTLVRTVTTGGTSATHNVAIDTVSGYLYRCGGGNYGLRIYSLANPSNPSYVKNWSDLYVHDVQVVTYTEGPYAGRQIAFACSGFNGGYGDTGIEILDVTNKNNIFSINRIEWSDRAYSHQCWISPDKKTLYANDELDEQTYNKQTTTHFYDISDLENPNELGAFSTGSTAIDHNLYTRGTLIFEANYRSGLRVFDATEPLNPVEVAYFDTFPDGDQAHFNGLWSNYPFFPSGTVIGSDIERGLFVWRLDGVPLSFRLPDGAPKQIPFTGASFPVEIIENIPGSLNAATPTLNYDYGAGYQQTPLVPVSGNTYEAVIPEVPCNSIVSYYLSADSIDDLQATSPINAPTNAYEALAAGDIVVVVSTDDMEADDGWVVDFSGTDTAVNGIWERVDPIGSIAQPDDDHSASGEMCWVTGQGIEGSIDHDVDDGRTTLTTAAFDLTGYNHPIIGYWLWYSNDQGVRKHSEFLKVRVSNDDGQTWTLADQVGPGGLESSGGWIYYEWRVGEFVAPTDKVRVQFLARDLNAQSLVEAAVDDFVIYDSICASDCPEDLDGDDTINLTDLGIMLANFGTSGVGLTGDLDNSGSVDLTDLGILLGVFGQDCP